MDFNQMIQEIHSQSLQSLLATVRSEESEPLNLQTSKFDASETRHHSPFDNLRLRRGDVVEIQGPPASGKTHLLYFLIIKCVIPTTYLSISLGGWDKVAVIFDTDASFDMARFERLLTSHLKVALEAIPVSDKVIELLVNQSLRNLHLFCPNSSVQLAATLLHLPSYHKNKLPEAEIGMVGLDSLSAFYWPDRFTSEQLRHTNRRSMEWDNPFRHVVTALERLHCTHKPMIIFTNWGLTQAKATDVDENTLGIMYRQHLNPSPALLRNVDVANSMISLPLTMHITLSLPAAHQLPVNLLFIDVCEHEFSGKSSGRCVGVVRFADSSEASQFTLAVYADHLSIE
ncbi:hypothetical protein GYMLUDRAFT_33297 [Collybiopsis luxurians FD-317 M1]|nr:hypothetical protein GYMLUDRAFT_33297 [Collybiopsis luxurians FD-317 M1]